jgi:hypothetical protein
LEVGRRKAEAMLILFRVRLSNEKIAKAPRYPLSKARKIGIRRRYDVGAWQVMMELKV